MIKKVLTIAGSDSSGGAGIQADLKTFAAHHLTGLSVITSVTSQNSSGVHGRYDLPPEVVEEQLRAVFEEGRPSAVKTGMLGNDAVVECLVRFLKRKRVKNLVVDPIIRSSGRKVLLSQKGVRKMVAKLFPLALLVTPNISEAEELSGLKVRTPSDRLRAAQAIFKTGAKNVLIKGGHLKGDPEDFFFDGKKSWALPAKRINNRDLHGTGCVLSAAIAANLAQGEGLVKAVRKAGDFVRESIAGAMSLGEGGAGVEPLSSLYKNEERYELIQRVANAVEKLKESRIGKLIPEVQSNIGVGVSGARGPEDVVAIPGRIIRNGDDIVTIASPRFGASQHVAKIALTVMSFDPSRRAVMNIRFAKSLLEVCRKLKFKVASFNREDEPRRVKQLEGSSLEWGTEKAIKECGFVPDVIYDLGGQGKEEMIRVIATDVESLVEKILKIHRMACKKTKAGKKPEKDDWRTW